MNPYERVLIFFQEQSRLDEEPRVGYLSYGWFEGKKWKKFAGLHPPRKSGFKVTLYTDSPVMSNILKPTIKREKRCSYGCYIHSDQDADELIHELSEVLNSI